MLLHQDFINNSNLLIQKNFESKLTQIHHSFSLTLKHFQGLYLKPLDIIYHLFLCSFIYLLYLSYINEFIYLIKEMNY